MKIGQSRLSRLDKAGQGGYARQGRAWQVTFSRLSKSGRGREVRLGKALKCRADILG
jgi:hypothetical protein